MLTLARSLLSRLRRRLLPVQDELNPVPSKFPLPSTSSASATKYRQLLENSGLFDHEYYVSAYREELTGYSAPIDHFIAIGQYLGFKPNSIFDPLLYLFHHPEAHSMGPLLHYLERRQQPAAAAIDLSAKSAFPRVSPINWSELGWSPELRELDFRKGPSLALTFKDAETTEFTVDGETCRLLTPSAEEFFKRLDADIPCAFPRLPHGFWDCLLAFEDARTVVASTVPNGLFSDQQLDLLASRACDELMPEAGVYSENFMPELLGGIQREPIDNGYLRSISFRWMPTADQRVFGRTEKIGPKEMRQMRLFAKHFGTQNFVYESTIWKRWTYSGDLQQLPLLARQRPVVLVGADRVKDLGRRWGLPWFIHLEIPLSSYRHRYAILDRCKEVITEAKEMAALHGTKRPFILLQGGSFAYWLISRLWAWDSSIFYLDLGQSLHIWFVDDRSVWMPWLLLHPRLIMNHCGLDEFYSDLGITLEPPFAEPQLRAEQAANKH